MATRQEQLQTILEDLLGSKEVYYQPPNNVKMAYPAIRYTLNDIYTRKADDSTYGKKREYQIIMMDWLPDNEVIDKILELPYSSYERHYEADNLNHDVISLYF